MTLSVHIPAAGIIKKPFGTLADGRGVDLYLLTNDNGMQASITTYGGIIVSLTAPDRNGVFADVVLGFDNLDDYLAGHPYLGAIIGRYANLIGKGTLPLTTRPTISPGTTTATTCTAGLRASTKPYGRRGHDLAPKALNFG